MPAGQMLKIYYGILYKRIVAQCERRFSTKTLKHCHYVEVNGAGIIQHQIRITHQYIHDNVLKHNNIENINQIQCSGETSLGENSCSRQ